LLSVAKKCVTLGTLIKVSSSDEFSLLAEDETV